MIHKSNLYFKSRCLSLTSLILALLLLTVTSCSDFETEPLDDEVIYNELAFGQFNNFLKTEISKINNRIRILGFSAESEANILFSQDSITEEEAELILSPLLEKSLTFLNATGFNNSNISKEFGDCKSPEIILTALIVMNNFDQKEKDSGGVPNIESNSIMKCLGSASGLTGILDLATGAAVASRSAILSAVGKFARRSLGWVGAAIFVGEFIGCYWGDNSVFN